MPVHEVNVAMVMLVPWHATVSVRVSARAPAPWRAHVRARVYGRGDWRRSLKDRGGGSKAGHTGMGDNMKVGA